MPNALDVIGPHTEHRVYGEILVRVVPLQPPAIEGIQPEPMYGVLAAAIHVSVGWISLWTVSTEDPPIAQLEDPDARDRIQRLSILIGATWEDVTRGLAGVIEEQDLAVKKLPPAVYDCEIDQLRRVRNKLNTNDPHMIANLLTLTYHWQTDPGGTHGPAHFA